MMFENEELIECQRRIRELVKEMEAEELAALERSRWEKIKRAARKVKE